MLRLSPPWPSGPGGAFVKSLGGLFDAPQGQLPNVGWSGFLDMHFLADSLGALLLGAALGAVIGFHPMTRRTVDTLAEAELPKVHLIFAFVGAVIGVTVREFGMVIGVVVFGIGGLLRFRTDAGSTRDNGRLIVVTLVGLIAGLGLPHLAVLTTLCAFVLIWFFDARPACRVRIEDLPQGRLAECANAYRAVLVGQGARIIGEHRSAAKGRVEFVLRLPRPDAREKLHAALCDAPLGVGSEITWDVE
ncbi:MAG TPA: hypothetical protein VMT68_10545 [Caulobacteraceae bacterium]|nr:hypothetical protein [Caulobacteraceae bacterium]